MTEVSAGPGRDESVVDEPAAGATFEPYESPAGGWGALQATARALREQSVSVEGARALLAMNQPHGFDCPGCAWPDPRHASSFDFCENGAKAVAFELTKRRVTREFFASHTVTELANHSDYWLEEQGRLVEPMRYDAASDHYVPVSWDDAFALVARHLNALASPDELELYTSGRASNEAAFLYQLFGRRFGTNNFPDCSNMCHEATSVGLGESIGIGKGTVLLEDFEKADAIFVIGQNPGTNSPRMMTQLRNAARRGAAVVAVNPLVERALDRFASPQSPVEMLTLGATAIVSEYCQVRVGGDIALFKGIMKRVIEIDGQATAAGRPPVIDRAFIERHTVGFDVLADDLHATSWSDILRLSGVSMAQIERIADVYASARAVIVCYGVGITQHSRSTECVQQIVDLLLLRGNIGRPGAGICPVRGHSNVQGNRTVGIDEKPSASLLDSLGRVFGFAPPRGHGHAVLDSLQAIVAGRSKAFIGLGGNFVAATSDSTVVHEAMRRLRLTVGINTKLNRGHLVHGEDALILPCLARSDIDRQASGRQSISVEDSMSMVHASSGLIDPPSNLLKSEVAIVCGVARATLAGGGGIDWTGFEADYASIRNAIEKVFPDLFASYNERLRVPGGFHLPNSASQRIWHTASGRAQFSVCVGLGEDPAGDDAGALRLTTIRSHDQYNTTIYGLDDRYRGVFGGRLVVFMNAEDMASRSISPGTLVELEYLGDPATPRLVSGFKAHPYAIPKGCIATYYPETNALIPLNHFDPRCKTPASKSVPVVVRPDRVAG